MFTGIIEEIGIVASLIRGPQTGKLAVSMGKIAAGLKIGDSIAVNGACLTITNLRRNITEFDLSLETLKKSSLQDLKVGDRVNLERALPVSGRLGGHMLTGHIDGIGEIRKKITINKGFEIHVSLPSDLFKYLVPKGSVALDGVSLTIADLREGMMVVSVIPHTAQITTLGNWNVGDRVNVEVDILSKYIERHLQREAGGSISDETLMRVGFLPMGWIDN